MIGRRLETKKHFDWLRQVQAGAGDSTQEDDSSILESLFAFVNLPELIVTEYIKIVMSLSVSFAHYSLRTSAMSVYYQYRLT
jgi:hypothetical protein